MISAQKFGKMYCNMTIILKRREKKVKFSMTETLCQLEMPSELPRQNSAEVYISKPETGERAAQISLSFVGK